MAKTVDGSSTQGAGEIEPVTREAKVSSIIIAAGMGRRMENYTEDCPKCMLQLGDKTILNRQLDAMQTCGIENVSVVRGYKKEKITLPSLTYYDNDDFESNNILSSLFYAEPALKGEVVISYSDIIYAPHVLNRLMESKHDISIVVDIDWRHTYKGRLQHPLDEAENVILDPDNKVLQIGKINAAADTLHGEFIGLMKFSAKGSEIFNRHFHRNRSLYAGKPFQRAKVFEKAYLTDQIQDMVDLGVSVHCVIIERGWREIDTVEDYTKAVEELKS